MKQLRTLWLAFLLTAFLTFKATAQQGSGLNTYQLEGITNVITDVALNNQQTQLCLAGIAGRVYAYQTSENGLGKELWRNTSLSGYNSGALVNYSNNSHYIIVKGFQSSMAKIRNVMFSKYQKAWQMNDNASILDAATGKELLAISNAYHISVSDNTAFVSTTSGFEWYSLPDGKKIKSVSVEDNECAAISPSGKYIVMSWDADKEDLKNVSSIVRRRTELKNAYRAKKLLVIYRAEDINKPIAYSNDEVDVVTNIFFDEDEKNVYIQCQLSAQENSTTATNTVCEKVDIASGTIDRNFGIKGNTVKFSGNYYGSLYSGGTIGMKKQIRIQNINNPDAFSSFETRIKFFKGSTLFSPYAISGTQQKAYVYYEKTLFEWKFNQLKSYFKKAPTASDEDLAVIADSLVDNQLQDVKSDLYKGISKNQITGNYIMDITVVGPKGAVQTIFCESDEKTNIAMQNKLKEIIKGMQLSTLNLPKEKRLKFRYTFELK